MLLSQHIALWDKIKQFQLDEPGAAITFSLKLASQQGWTAGYTQRVIEEYRRFMLLCCISPNGASPSKAVDEAWHLHLTYTQSYWIAFCKNTLGKNIHHHPSSGGEQQDHKHLNWYEETLNFYQQVFGTTPPDDIWPSGVKKTYPVVPPLAPQTNLFSLLLLIPVGLIYLLYDEVSPFSLSGPEFLEFYAMLMGAALLGLYLQRDQRKSQLTALIKEYFPGDVSVYQLAHLVHGRHRAIQTGVVDLFRRDLLQPTGENDIVVHNKRYSANDKEENPLVPGFLAEANESKVNYEMMSVNWYNEGSYKHPVIEQLNVLAFSEEGFARKYLVIIIAFAIGAARILQGLLNGRPVVFLVEEMIIFAVLAYFLNKMISGKNLLHQAADAKLSYNQMHKDEVVAGFAATGHGALYGLAAGVLLASMFSSFNVLPVHQTSSWSGGSDNSCSSTSSCSGGSSDGGSVAAVGDAVAVAIDLTFW